MHVGKFYPHLPSWRIWLPPYVQYSMARKVFMGNDPSATRAGTLAIEWTSSRFSDVGEIDPANPNKVVFSATALTNPDNELRITLEMVEGADPDTPLVNYHFHALTEVWYLGTRMGWRELDLDYLEGLQAGRTVNVNTAWNDLVNPTLFTAMQVVKRPQTWAEAPDYHPYRH